MTVFGWVLVFLPMNGAIILLGLRKTFNTHQSVDWFPVALTLPRWTVELSMFATAVDSGDSYDPRQNLFSSW